MAMLVGATSAAAQPQSSAPSAAIDSGAIRGAVDGDVVSYKGIPYAAPPVGVLRWRPPQAPAPWASPRDATAYGNDCMQNRFPGDSAASSQPLSEDCLYLNVWAPAHAGAHLPVMVWIHGGGLTTGSSAPAVYSGANLARKGVVLVSFNYRLGRFGFFAHPALLKEHPGEAVGNYGLMDQLAALRWVQRNIAAFGGDPANVTIFGQSAGGSSVLHMMMCPEAHGLFARAIAESGGGRDRWSRLDGAAGGKPSALKIGEAFARKAGVTSDDPAALRAIPAQTVLGDLGLLNGEAETYSGAIVDGALVPDDVDTFFARGAEQHVPLLIGATNDELGAVPAAFLPMLTGPVVEKFGPRGKALQAFYGAGAHPADLFDDISFVEPARYLAGRHAAAGAPTWLYRFSYVAEARRDGGAGAAHASEIPYVFGTLDAAGFQVSALDRKMSAAMMDCWVAFARGGDPNGAGLAAWPGYDAGADPTLEFTLEGTPTVRPHLDQQRLDFIAASYPLP
ncbi:MAG: carboxylesterase family protein [Rhizomicrobium sp.]